MFSYDLVRVFIAACSSDTHFLIINIKDEVMLSHQRPAYYNLATVLYIKRYAVLVAMLAIEIFTWVPVKRDVLFLGA